MQSRLARLCCRGLLLAITCSSPAIAGAGEFFYRMYGYLPRVYGYPPSSYVYPRYGFERGYVYVQRPPYGSPALGPPAQCPGEFETPSELSAPHAQIEPVEVGRRLKSTEPNGHRSLPTSTAVNASSRVE